MKFIQTDDAPAPVGPYSQAVEANGFLFLSGQLGVDPETGEMATDIRGQTAQVFSNLGAVLAEAGLGPGDVVKVNATVRRGRRCRSPGCRSTASSRSRRSPGPLNEKTTIRPGRRTLFTVDRGHCRISTSYPEMGRAPSPERPL